MNLRTIPLLALLLASAPVLAQTDSDSPQGPKKEAALPPSSFFVSGMLSYTLADEDRGTDDGYGGTLTVGRWVGDEVALEVSGFYTRMGAAAGGDSLALTGLGVDAMMFPLVNYPNLYGLAGAYYGRARNQPGAVADYSSVVVDMGVGYLYPLSKRLILRGDWRLRLDAHGDKQAGTTTGEDRAFSENVFNLGLLVPFGLEGMPAAAAEPVAVTPTGSIDSDNDGVPDIVDQCPDTPAGAVVDANGCPVERRFELRGVTFEFDSDRLTPEAEQVLAGMVDTLKEYGEIRLEVAGYTDWIGSEEYNQGLSKRRARAVARFLAAHGLPSSRLRAAGYGESQPIDTNDTFEGRENNRRVELKVMQ